MSGVWHRTCSKGARSCDRCWAFDEVARESTRTRRTEHVTSSRVRCQAPDTAGTDLSAGCVGRAADGNVGAVPNRLAGETSPYLLQHAHNPVDWYPWGDEAFARARAEDKPVLLSVGYSACHWCHVMEHESFENEAIAALMNEHFVCIKVDREERPDVDQIYMSAVQAMTGRGGWPMTVFLTPDGQPFYGGTYYPPEERHGLPGFPRVLLSVAQAYRERRADVEESAGKLTGHISATINLPRPEGALTVALLDRATQALKEQYD